MACPLSPCLTTNITYSTSNCHSRNNLHSSRSTSLLTILSSLVCTTCFVSVSWLPKEARRYIVQSNIQVNGITGNVSIVGELICDIILGEHNSLIFKNMEILVTTSMTQILIGQNILNHYSLTSYSINNQNAMVEFRHILPSGGMTHIAPLLPITNLNTFPTYNTAHGVQTIIRNEV